MKRFAIVLFGLMLTASAAAAQVAIPTLPLPPSPTPQPTAIVIEVLPEATPLEVVPIDVTPATEGITEATPLAPVPTIVPLSLEAAEALPILVNARGDLELLARQVMAGDSRPTGWSGSIDVTDAQLPLLVRLDLEILAGTVGGAENRPEGWFGVVASSPLAIARDIRHDLELLADIVVGAPTIRPGLWVGDDPLMRCNRATQALVPVLERSGFGLNVDYTQVGYCNEIEIQASRFVETQIIQPPAPNGSTVTGPVAGIAQPYLTETPFVVAFYDRNARRRAGVLPVGTGFRPISRSDFEFSNMMIIEGEGFTLFVDYTTTPLSTTEFLALPTVSLGTTTDCDMTWCD